ncbi:DNA glycosylase AlkZ-like family protein [Streptomyces bacillaris]|uniref:DNA glycosylase AlkZ-like family protein n=1 Tax=Streptomyces bacillaris TaxID=68179 RepID=UPI0039080485
MTSPTPPRSRTSTRTGPRPAAAVGWREANARRLARQHLRTPAPDVSPADVVGAVLGAHAQVLSAAELSVGLRGEGLTRTDVRTALWAEDPARRTLVKTFGPRGTVHLLPSAELPLWTGALAAVPTGPNPFAKGARMTPEQVEEVVAAIGEALTGVELTVDELSDEVVARTGPGTWWCRASSRCGRAGGRSCTWRATGARWPTPRTGAAGRRTRTPAAPRCPAQRRRRPWSSGTCTRTARRPRPTSPAGWPHPGSGRPGCSPRWPVPG